MDERIDLVGETAAKKPEGVSVATAVSIAVHTILLILFIRAHRAAPEIESKSTPIARYVELIRANPREFVEAPGPAVDRAPLNAPFSDANRRASIPEPTGDRPTDRPGDGRGLYTPPSGGPAAAPRSSVAARSREDETDGAPQSTASPSVSSRIPAFNEASAMAGDVNWRSAIREIGKLASAGGPGSIDLSGVEGGGGETGTAEAGPLSFETQWYDWGEYAQSMVSRIRVNWYNVMPPLIRTGMSGVVTIRFTIHRDGRIADVTMLESSTIPPYDMAAKKAIELSSPLNPLPKDFPKPSERVTAMFYYNKPVPSR